MRLVTVFEQVDSAATVALGRAIPRGLRSREVLRGAARRVVPIRAGDARSSCTPRIRRGREALVFLSAGGAFVAHYQSYVERPDPLLLDVVRRYAAASDDDARRALLVELAAGSGTIAEHAALYLADRPDLLAHITAPEQARVVGAISLASASQLPALARLAARLRAMDAIPQLVARLTDVRYVEGIAVPLEILTNHEQPLEGADDTSEGGRWYAWRQAYEMSAFGAELLDEPVPSAAELSQAYWARWASEHRDVTWQQRWALGFEERGLRAAALDRPAALAEAIRSGPDTLTRVVALDRCEMQWGRRLFHFERYAHGTAAHVWPALASACETGVAYPW